MKLLHSLAIATAILSGAGLAEAADISNSSLPAVNANTPDQQNVSPDRTRDSSLPAQPESDDNYPTAEDYPQGESAAETISNSSVGVVESKTSGQIDVINSMIGAVKPEDAAGVNLINSSVGAVQSDANPQVDLNNSKLGAVESASTNQQNPFQGGSGAQAPAQGGPPASGAAMGSGSNSPDYPTSADYQYQALRGAGAPAKAVPEPSSALATLALGALGGGLILKRKLQTVKLDERKLQAVKLDAPST